MSHEKGKDFFLTSAAKAVNQKQSLFLPFLAPNVPQIEKNLTRNTSCNILNECSFLTQGDTDHDKTGKA
jgi:hypothetical protein